METEKGDFPWWRRSSASFRGARGGEWLPTASELPVDLGERVFILPISQLI